MANARTHRLPLILLSVILLLVWLSCSDRSAPGADSIARFERIGPYGGEVRSLLISSRNPKFIFLGTTDGQLYKSSDSGLSWSLLLPGIGRRQLVIDTLVEHPADAGHFYAGGWDLRSKGGALFESVDGGTSWLPVPLPENSPAVRDLAICRDRAAFMIIGTLAGAYVTDDAGTHWRQVSWAGRAIENVESVAIDPQNPQFLFIGTWRLGYRSIDFGKSWVSMDQGMILDSDVFSIAVDGRNPQVVYSSACSGIYRSDNRAQTWTRLKVLPDRFAIRTQLIYIDPTNSHRVYGGTTEGLFVTSNDGQSWTRLTSAGLTINAVQVDPADGGRIILGTREQGILLSEDSGRTWRESNNGFVSRQVARIVADPDSPGRLYILLSSDEPNGGVFAFDASGNRWTALTAELAKRTRVLSFLALPAGRGRMAGTAEGVYWQKNPSAPWSIVGQPARRQQFNGFALDPEGRWIFASSREGIYRTAPKIIDFQRPVARGQRPELHALTVSDGSPAILYAASNLGIIRSKDLGITWETITSGIPPRAIAECVAACPGEREHLLAGTNSGLFESRDGGETWYRAADSRLGIDVPSVIFLDSEGKRIMAADNTFGGVFLSLDGGMRWEKIESQDFGSPVRWVAPDPANPLSVYLGTRSEGVYRLHLGENSAGDLPR